SHTQITLGTGSTMTSRQPIPVRGFPLVLRHALAETIAHGQAGFGLWKILLRCLAIPSNRFLIVLTAAISADITIAEIASGLGPGAHFRGLSCRQRRRGRPRRHRLCRSKRRRRVVIRRCWAKE